MKSKIFAFIIPVSILWACGSSSNSNTELTIPESGYEFQLIQRKHIDLPSKERIVSFSIGDITRGHTTVTIEDGYRMVTQANLYPGSSTNFIINGKEYKAECVRLFNHKIGDDYGVFKVKKFIDHTANTKIQINDFIIKIRNSNVKFIRNGKEYTSAEAASHLKMKYEKMENDIYSL